MQKGAAPYACREVLESQRMFYPGQHEAAFWKNCRDDAHFLIDQIYQPKHPLQPGDRIATAGSCFAQNIGRFLKASDLEFIDVEPAPTVMPKDVRAGFGYDLFSARYGNIYTARQFLQLLQDSMSLTLHDEAVWERENAYFDALRPGVEATGFADPEHLRLHRVEHLKRVRSIFEDIDVFIFTLGLTETWQSRKTGLVFPSVPGLIAGQFDPATYSFINLGFSETMDDMQRAVALLQELAPNIRVLLTVSPVPLTATATPKHVLSATTYSKSVLRAVAGEMAMHHQAVDYFPSFEMITGLPFAGQSYAENLRSIRASAIDTVMSTFFASHPDLDQPDFGGGFAPRAQNTELGEDDDPICEDALLEAFVDK